MARPVATDVLPDVLAPGLRVVFCGTAAGPRSARIGAPYAGPGNRFWPTLHAVGLTPVALAPLEFARVLEWGIGLTDASKVGSGRDHHIAAGEWDAARLHASMERYAPGVLAFTSKRAAAVATGSRSTAGLRYGPQDRTVGGVPTWIVPSPSGAARAAWSIAPWQALATALGPTST